jgi:hypothetical protein
MIDALIAPRTALRGGGVVKYPAKCDHRQTKPENYAAVRSDGPYDAASQRAEHTSKHEQQPNDFRDHDVDL